ncbi:MAG: hypothetical protein RR382_00005, partial [Tannerellaceae bacterium]
MPGQIHNIIIKSNRYTEYVEPVRAEELVENDNTDSTPVQEIPERIVDNAAPAEVVVEAPVEAPVEAAPAEVVVEAPVEAPVEAA